MSQSNQPKNVTPDRSLPSGFVDETRPCKHCGEHPSIGPSMMGWNYLHLCKTENRGFGGTGYKTYEKAEREWNKCSAAIPESRIEPRRNR